MMIGWTTVSGREAAEKLARDAVGKKLAACCQVDGPIRSFYEWEGEVQNDEEFRVTFKFLREKTGALEEWLFSAHPYETPQWLAIPAERISQKYLIWAKNEAK